MDCSQFEIKRSVTHNIFNKFTAETKNNTQDTIGGVLRNGELGWIAIGSQIFVFFLESGRILASYNFKGEFCSQCDTITCVSEVELPDPTEYILAIGLKCAKNRGKVCLFDVQGPQRLRIIEILNEVTSCCFIRSSPNDEVLQFDGCLAIGTDIGRIILIDLALAQCEEVLSGYREVNLKANCVLALASVGSNEKRWQQKYAMDCNMNFGIRLEALSDSIPVTSMLSLPPCESLAIGMGDGRILLYSLSDLEAYHSADPPELNSPIIKMAFCVYDPSSLVYVWASHANAKMPITVMHIIKFSTKFLNNNNCFVYEDFEKCYSQLTMHINVPQAFPIACQTVSKMKDTDEEHELQLCMLAWSAPGVAYACVFCLNQWYTEKTPKICDMAQETSYLAVFKLDHTINQQLNVWMDESTLTPFDTLAAYEKLSSSLSFDCVYLSRMDCLFLQWTGNQDDTSSSSESYRHDDYSETESDEYYCGTMNTGCGDDNYYADYNND